MANIYEEKDEPLYRLLERAGVEDGATVLIPDLQRPYVWTPKQVTLLVDSLIRGWPFGTLLMWNVGQGELQNIPHRPFWRVVDRTSDGNGSAIARRDPPASFNMVLDGQQRVQSLLLALGGDSWGFKQDDRAWALELQDRRLRGRQGKYRHWSKASLCFDLDRFLVEYRAEKDLLAVDYDGAVLRWAITDPVGGQSPWPKPPGYEEPLPRAFVGDGKGCLVRLSRLWAAAAANPNLKEAQFREVLNGVFVNEGIPNDKTERLLGPMGELMTTFRDLKLSKIAYLELLPFASSALTEDAYNDAIVNIFTRLNSAGRTLTREEITLAWLKVGWDPAATSGQAAGDCFQQLLEDVREENLDIDIDDLVSAVSFIWAVCCNEGKLLANKDLLRGATIRPMAAALSSRWEMIRKAVVDGLKAVRRRDLEYGASGHYSSVNALAVVWAWLYISLQWGASHSLTAPQRDDFEKKIERVLSSVLDRWLICSQWAGRWSGSSANAFAGYAKDLRESFVSSASLDSLDRVVDVLGSRFDGFVRDLDVDAASFVTTLAASSRERVSVYRTPLWLWHRLDRERWRISSIPLRTGRGKGSLDVDHAVAFRLWNNKLAAAMPPGVQDHDEALGIVNQLGNCSLLEKTFNISKSDKPLRSFMVQVHEIMEGRLELSEWAQALGLADSMLDPSHATVDEVAQAILARDASIRAELIEFVKGTKSRRDFEYVRPLSPRTPSSESLAAPVFKEADLGVAAATGLTRVTANDLLNGFQEEVSRRREVFNDMLDGAVMISKRGELA